MRWALAERQGIGLKEKVHTIRKTKGKGCMRMNSLKNRLQFLAAVLLLVLVVFMAWYLLFQKPGSLYTPDGTLVCHPHERMVKAA